MSSAKMLTRASVASCTYNCGSAARRRKPWRERVVAMNSWNNLGASLRPYSALRSRQSLPGLRSVGGGMMKIFASLGRAA
eukprot:7046440-Heterocapsa_arctica.AAC.1